MDYEEFSYVNVAINDDGLAVLRLNRPDKMNACTVEEHSELPRLLRRLQSDPAVRVAIVTGAGKAFSVGGDYELLERANTNQDSEIDRIVADGRELILAHIDLEKPIIAAVNGYAMGAGAALALLCDVIVADRSALIADGHVRAAIAAGDGGALIWPLTVGLAKAKWYLMTGDWITATEAERCGLITEVVDDGEALNRAHEIAERFLHGPQTAVRYTKRALNQWLRLGFMTSFDLSLHLEALTMLSDDARRAVQQLRATNKGLMPPPRRRGPELVAEASSQERP